MTSEIEACGASKPCRILDRTDVCVLAKGHQEDGSSPWHATVDGCCWHPAGRTEPKKIFTISGNALYEEVEAQIVEAIHAEVCTAYTHPGPNAHCHRSARAAVGVLQRRASEAIREALGVSPGLSKDPAAD